MTHRKPYHFPDHGAPRKGCRGKVVSAFMIGFLLLAGGIALAVTMTHQPASGAVTKPQHCPELNGSCTGIVFYMPHQTWLCQLTQYPYDGPDFFSEPGYTCKKEHK